MRFAMHLTRNRSRTADTRRRAPPSWPALLLLALPATVCLAGSTYDPGQPATVDLAEVAQGLGDNGQIFPTDLVAFPDGSGRLLISTLGGSIRLIDGTLTATPYIDTVSDDTINAENGNASFGLTTVAFHPDFANVGTPGFGRLYTVEPEVTRANPPPDFPGIRNDFVGGNNPAHDRVLYEYRADSLSANAFAGLKREVLRIHEHRRGHDVNDLAFDAGGYLYIAVGDTVISGSAQELDNVFGTIMRIDPLAPEQTPGSTDPVSANGAYRIPADNPFLSTADAVPEIFAYGLRNPFRIFVDQLTDELWVSSNGASSRESVYQVSLGDNLGWPFFEGTRQNNPPPSGFSYVPPVFEYTHSLGQSVTGIVVYRGSNLSELTGRVVFSDFLGSGSGGARVFFGDPLTGVYSDLEASGPVELPSTLVSIGLDQAGEMYFLGGDGRVLATTPDGLLFRDGFESD
ncbi:MAG: PQQ-dependent sugar dehydrogenase [Pseudomonadota bacterium]